MKGRLEQRAKKSKPSAIWIVYNQLMSAMTSSQSIESAHRQFRSGRLAEAERILRQVLQQEPRHSDALHLLGLVASQSGHQDEAVRLVQAAIGANPNRADFRVNLGGILLKLGRNDEAIECARAAMAIDPFSSHAPFLLGNALVKAGRGVEAVDAYRQAMEKTPNLLGMMLNLAYALQGLGQLDEAAGLFESVLSFAPNCAGACSHLGAILYPTEQIDRSLALHRKALLIEPENVGFHWYYAIALLTNGDFAEGWEEFEWRLRFPELNLYRASPQPQWDGSDLAGKTIVLHNEGGFGDGIFFARYVPMVAGRGGRIILDCQPELTRLFARIPAVESIIPRGDPLPAFDTHIALPGLPRLFQTRLENIPGSVPYLTAGPKEAEYWKQRLSQNPGPKIGLAWSGSSNDMVWRSRTLEIFSPLAGVRGIQFYSLQKGPEAKQPIPPGLSMIDYTDELHDFADTAGLIANLDMVISVDTSVAHLAGAMGKPTWTLIPYACDFRWLRSREDSPWYPTMRLFRQGQDRNWNRVAERVAGELRSRFG